MWNRFYGRIGKKNQGRIPKPGGTPLTIDKTIATINSLKHLFLIQESPLYSQVSPKKDCSKSKPYLDEKVNL